MTEAPVMLLLLKFAASLANLIFILANCAVLIGLVLNIHRNSDNPSQQWISLGVLYILVNTILIRAKQQDGRHQ